MNDNKIQKQVFEISALDMFSIGIGPSSSHTIGPMRAAFEFISILYNKGLLMQLETINIDLYGSLALTGEGHGTILAILNGLAANDPKTISADNFMLRSNAIINSKKLIINYANIIAKNNNQSTIDISDDILLQQSLRDYKQISFDIEKDVIFHKNKFLPEHSNAVCFTAFDSTKQQILFKKYFSIGGGFILDELQIADYIQITNSDKQADNKIQQIVAREYSFKSAKELFSLCRKHNISIAEVVYRQELEYGRTRAEVYSHALEILAVMHKSIDRGIKQSGILPGGLNVRRRAKDLYEKLIQEKSENYKLFAMTYAIAVNEENAAFSKIVTAPTNGAAGTIPAVIEYYRNFCDGATEEKLVEFLLTAGAIGMLYKFGASISAAEVGCQGEIGVACSMAAGALNAVLGGSLIQIEKSAEIAMEHNLGMTCDPVAGLVQIPCIERNAVASSKAIDIARLALLEDLPGIISLDDVIKTMLQTGRDMSLKYKETSTGGLAVNIVNC